VHYNAVFGGGKKIGKHLNAEAQRKDLRREEREEKHRGS
jgi:hypothetical protein